MRKVIAGLLVLLLCLVGVGLGPPPSVAVPVVVYDFLVNASRANWSGWIPITGSYQLTYGTMSFTGGFATNFSGTLEDGQDYSNAVETYPPSHTPSTPDSVIVGEYNDIDVPVGAQLELIYGFRQGANATDGVEVRVEYSVGGGPAPSFTLLEQSKTYDGALGKATVDLSPYWGEVGNFHFSVHSGATAMDDAWVWVKAVITMTTFTAVPFSTSTTLTFHINSPTYLVGGAARLMDTAPVIVESRTFLPIRYVVEALGAEIEWSAPDQKVTITFGEKTIELWIGNNSATVNGDYVYIDPGNPNVAPFIQDPGRTMMPLRFIAETLGCKVDWLPPDEVKITYPAS